MNIRRKSTTHDLATLRLHPDGSRVQQSSLNTRRRTATSTVLDPRGNWIAKDAGGKSSIKRRRKIDRSYTRDADGEFIGPSDDEGHACSQSKGKQRARDDETPDEDLPQDLGLERLNPRTRQRLSFMCNLSFLDPAPVSVSSLEQDTGFSDATSPREPFVSFSDPAPDLLKAIHHFASCYFLERGQLCDSSRDYRGEKKERSKQSHGNIHTLAANAPKYQDINSESEHSETEDETIEESEDDNEVTNAGDSRREGPSTKAGTYSKDMYKAFEGSALMAIGIVLQEHVAHTLLSRPHISQEPQSTKRRRAE